MATMHTTQSVQTGITETIRGFEEGMAQGNAAGIAACYMDDARVLPPNSEIVTGKTAIQAFWQSTIDMGIKGITFDMQEVEVQGDTAWEIGQAVLTIAGGQVADRVKYIVIWKEEQGRWRKYRGTWNSNTPA